MDTPPDCMDIIELLRGKAEERKEGVRLLFELPFIRYYTVYWYGRYLPRIKIKYPEWTDLYLRTILEIVNEVEEGRGPRTNCKGYVTKLCQNLCEKTIRDIREDEALDQALTSLLSDSPRSKLREWVDSILKKMECKCETLLRWRYLQHPPVKEKEKLAELLQEECGKEYSPTAIPVHLHDCRDKFRKLAQESPFDFDDFNP